MCFLTFPGLGTYRTFSTATFRTNFLSVHVLDTVRVGLDPGSSEERASNNNGTVCLNS